MDMRPSTESKIEILPEEESIIQWETAAFYTFESEVNGHPLAIDEPEPPVTTMTLGIVRLGSAKGVARVQWSTFDKDAVAGKNYVQVAPQWVEFGDGVTHVDVTVDVLHCPTFDGTVEFGLYIDEETVQNASIGKYLHSSCVKIIDQSAFPTNFLESSVLGGDPEKIADISPTLLVLNFLKFCWTNPVTRLGSIKTIFALQWHSFVAVLNILILFFIVQLFSRGQTSDYDKQRQMLTFSFMWVGPFLVSHALNYSQQFWKVGGSLKLQLQMLLLKKFLNYTDDSRSCVAIEKLMMALVRDVTTSVNDGYGVALDMVFGTLFRIGYLVMTMVYIQTASGSGVNWRPIVAIFILPVVLYAFLSVRQKQLFELRAKQFAAESLAIHHVIKTVLNYQLVKDYDRTSFMLQQYQLLVGAVNNKTVAINSNIVNSRAMAPWLTTFMVGGYMVVGGSQVISGTIPLATFLSTISLFRAVGGEFEKAYTQSLAITNSYASISQLTMFLNLPVDVPMRRKIARARRRYGRELRDDHRHRLEVGEVAPLQHDELPVDALPLVLANVSFSYLLSNPLRTAELKHRSAAAASSSSEAASNQHLNHFESLRSSLDFVSRGVGHLTPDAVELGMAPDSDDLRHTNAPKERVYSKVEIQNASEKSPFQQRQPSHVRAANKWVKKVKENREAATRIQSMMRVTLARLNFKRRLVQVGGGLKIGTLEIPQGKIVAFVGPPTSGKATIMKLLANQIFPNLDDLADGDVTKGGKNADKTEHFVPPHLRVVQVSETPMILGPEESIFDNLIFGIKLTPTTDFKLLELRARNIMKRLRLTPALLDHHFTQKGFIGADGCRLTRTNRQLINLGRALVMNPEVLIVHKPDSFFDDSYSDLLMEIFLEFVSNRGVCMNDGEPLWRRRKRTLIFSPTEEVMATQADVVFEAKDGRVELRRSGREGGFSTATTSMSEHGGSSSSSRRSSFSSPSENQRVPSLAWDRSEMVKEGARRAEVDSDTSSTRSEAFGKAFWQQRSAGEEELKAPGHQLSSTAAGSEVEEGLLERGRAARAWRNDSRKGSGGGGASSSSSRREASKDRKKRRSRSLKAAGQQPTHGGVLVAGEDFDFDSIVDL